MCSLGDYGATYHTPLAAEVNAIIHGIRLLQRMNISNACVFSYSLVAVKMIQGEMQIMSDVYHWIIQIQEMKRCFQELSFYHISQDHNRRADFLARDALARRQSRLWLENLPQWLSSMSNHTNCKCNLLCTCSY